MGVLRMDGLRSKISGGMRCEQLIQGKGKDWRLESGCVYMFYFHDYKKFLSLCVLTSCFLSILLSIPPFITPFAFSILWKFSTKHVPQSESLPFLLTIAWSRPSRRPMLQVRFL